MGGLGAGRAVLKKIFDPPRGARRLVPWLEDSVLLCLAAGKAGVAAFTCADDRKEELALRRRMPFCDALQREAHGPRGGLFQRDGSWPRAVTLQSPPQSLGAGRAGLEVVCPQPTLLPHSYSYQRGCGVLQQRRPCLRLRSAVSRGPSMPSVLLPMPALLLPLPATRRPPCSWAPGKEAAYSRATRADEPCLPGRKPARSRPVAPAATPTSGHHHHLLAAGHSALATLWDRPGAAALRGFSGFAAPGCRTDVAPREEEKPRPRNPPPMPRRHPPALASPSLRMERFCAASDPSGKTAATCCPRAPRRAPLLQGRPLLSSDRHSCSRISGNLGGMSSRPSKAATCSSWRNLELMACARPAMPAQPTLRPCPSPRPPTATSTPNEPPQHRTNGPSRAPGI